MLSVVDQMRELYDKLNHEIQELEAQITPLQQQANTIAKTIAKLTVDSTVKMRPLVKPIDAVRAIAEKGPFTVEELGQEFERYGLSHTKHHLRSALSNCVNREIVQRVGPSKYALIVRK